MLKHVWTAREVFARPNFPLGVRYAYPQPPEPLHTHDRFSELVIVYDGAGKHITGEEIYPVQSGDCFVITGNRNHGYTDINNLHLVNVLFDHGHILERIPHIQKLPAYHVLFCLEPRYRNRHQFESRLHLGPEALGHVLNLVGTLKQELDLHHPGYEFMATSLFMQIVGHLCRCYTHSSDTKAHSLMRMGKVLGYMQSHYRRPISLEELVAYAGMSKRSFMRVFHEATGLSPIDYLIRLRIAKACALLGHSKQSITEIAYEVGFEDSNYFTRQFKRVVGESPGRYRQHRHEHPITPPPIHMPLTTPL